jgi:DNA-binding transcriptional LysR family regulator
MLVALRNGDIDVGFLGIAGKVHRDLPSGIGSAVEFVRHGVGLAVQPAYAIKEDDDAIRPVRITGQTFEWSLYMATLRKRKRKRKRKPTAALRALLGRDASSGLRIEVSARHQI